jgi:hypothetical protein
MQNHWCKSQKLPEKSRFLLIIVCFLPFLERKRHLPMADAFYIDGLIT